MDEKRFSRMVKRINAIRALHAHDKFSLVQRIKDECLENVARILVGQILPTDSSEAAIIAAIARIHNSREGVVNFKHVRDVQREIDSLWRMGARRYKKNLTAMRESIDAGFIEAFADDE